MAELEAGGPGRAGLKPGGIMTEASRPAPVPDAVKKRKNICGDMTALFSLGRSSESEFVETWVSRLVEGDDRARASGPRTTGSRSAGGLVAPADVGAREGRSP